MDIPGSRSLIIFRASAHKVISTPAYVKQGYNFYIISGTVTTQAVYTCPPGASLLTVWVTSSQMNVDKNSPKYIFKLLVGLLLKDQFLLYFHEHVMDGTAGSIR